MQVKDLLIKSRLYEALKSQPTTASGEDSVRFEVSKSVVSNEDWEELNLKAASIIRLCLEKNILANVFGISTPRGFGKSLSKCIKQRFFQIGCT